jgi:hypothetical protein
MPAQLFPFIRREFLRIRPAQKKAPQALPVHNPTIHQKANPAPLRAFLLPNCNPFSASHPRVIAGGGKVSLKIARKA